MLYILVYTYIYIIYIYIYIYVCVCVCVSLKKTFLTPRRLGFLKVFFLGDQFDGGGGLYFRKSNPISV